MTRSYALRDDQWDRIKVLLPGRCLARSARALRGLPGGAPAPLALESVGCVAAHLLDAGGRCGK